VGLRLNLFLTILFSFVYFQYCLNRIRKEKMGEAETLVLSSDSSGAE
jgi:hypothetical protein